MKISMILRENENVFKPGDKFYVFYNNDVREGTVVKTNGCKITEAAFGSDKIPVNFTFFRVYLTAKMCYNSHMEVGDLAYAAYDNNILHTDIISVNYIDDEPVTAEIFTYDGIIEVPYSKVFATHQDCVSDALNIKNRPIKYTVASNTVCKCFCLEDGRIVIAGEDRSWHPNEREIFSMDAMYPKHSVFDTETMCRKYFKTISRG